MKIIIKMPFYLNTWDNTKENNAYLREPMKAKHEWLPCVTLGNIMYLEIRCCPQKVMLSKFRIKKAQRS